VAFSVGRGGNPLKALWPGVRKTKFPQPKGDKNYSPIPTKRRLERTQWGRKGNHHGPEEGVGVQAEWPANLGDGLLELLRGGGSKKKTEVLGIRKFLCRWGEERGKQRAIC